MQEVKITKERFAIYADWQINQNLYYCPNCESLIERGDNYCPNCGVKLIWDLNK